MAFSLAPHIAEFEVIDPAQVRLALEAPAGRLVSNETSTDLTNWAPRSTISIGASGMAETVISVSGNAAFFRFVLQ